MYIHVHTYTHTHTQHGCHIVGISGGSPETGGISKVVTQGMLFKIIGPALTGLTILARHVMSSPAIVIKSDSKAYKAFEIMVNKGISGLAVVDEDGIIIHNTSTSDLKVCFVCMCVCVCVCVYQRACGSR